MTSTMILGFWWCWWEYYWETIEKSGYGTAMKLENTRIGACNVRFPSCGGCWGGEEGKNVVNDDDLWTFKNRWAIDDVILFSILVHVLELVSYISQSLLRAFLCCGFLSDLYSHLISAENSLWWPCEDFLYVTSLSSILERWPSVFVVSFFWSCLSVRGVLGKLVVSGFQKRILRSVPSY